MAQTVIGLFDNSAEAQQAVQQLVTNGFSRDRIDVTSKSATTSEAGTSDSTLGTSTGTSSSASTLDSGTGTSRTEESGSGIGKFFRSLFGDDDEANTYSNVAQKAGSIVTVHAQTSEEAEEAADILDDAGAVDVNERAAQFGYNQDTRTSNTVAENVTGDTETTIPIIKEQLQVGKQTVETGGKRLRSRIVERPVEEDLRLREERVWVERNTVNRPATEADLANFSQTEIEMVERAEVPVVAKQARVVEEVSLGKEVDERVETVRDTVRSTEVDVEDIENDVNSSQTTRRATGTTDKDQWSEKNLD